MSRLVLKTVGGNLVLVPATDGTMTLTFARVTDEGLTLQLNQEHIRVLTAWLAGGAFLPARDSQLSALRRLLDAEIEIVRLRKESEQDQLQLIKESDHYRDMADKLAYAVASIEVIGEHSSGNDPWVNALGLTTPHAEVEKLRNRVAELETERHVTNELLSKADERVAELTKQLPSVKTPPPPLSSVALDSPSSRLAQQLSRNSPDLLFTETRDATTLAVDVEPKSLSDWDGWLRRFHVRTGAVTHHGSFATAKGWFGSVSVLLTGHGVGALYAAALKDR